MVLFDLESFLLISGFSGFSLFTIEHIQKPGIHGKFYSHCFMIWIFHFVWLSIWQLLWNLLPFSWFPAFPAILGNGTGPLITLLAQLVSILRAKLQKGVIRGEIFFFFFFFFFLFLLSCTFSQIFRFWGCDNFSSLVVIQLTQIFSGCTYFKIYIFDEAFSLLTIIMSMIIKLSSVVTWRFRRFMNTKRG